MEKNISNWYDLNKRLIEIFEKLNYKYEKVDLPDDDLNFIILVDISNSKYSNLKPLKSVEGFMYISSIDKSLHFMSVNLYKIKNIDDLEKSYRLINEINSIINHGNFSINEESNSIVYRAVVDYDDNYDIISQMTIKKIIDDFLYNLSVFLLFTYRMKNEHK